MCLRFGDSHWLGMRILREGRKFTFARYENFEEGGKVSAAFTEFRPICRCRCGWRERRPSRSEESNAA
jgi:hypothetical protein